MSRPVLVDKEMIAIVGMPLRHCTLDLNGRENMADPCVGCSGVVVEAWEIYPMVNIWGLRRDEGWFVMSLEYILSSRMFPAFLQNLS